MKIFKLKLGYALCILLLTCTFCLAQTSNKAYTMVKTEITNDSVKQKSADIYITFIRLMEEY